MRMTVYGNNATCPEADGACSCFLIEAEGRRILLDMGNGSLAKLQKDVDLAALDLIAISHLHFDHFGDLFCAKYQLESRRACGEAIPRIPLLTPRLPDGRRGAGVYRHGASGRILWRSVGGGGKDTGLFGRCGRVSAACARRRGRGPVFVRGDADARAVCGRGTSPARRHGGTSGCGKRSKAPAVDALPYTAGADCPAGGPRML